VKNRPKYNNKKGNVTTMHILLLSKMVPPPFLAEFHLKFKYFPLKSERDFSSVVLELLAATIFLYIPPGYRIVHAQST
jgi:hypothetical protein